MIFGLILLDEDGFPEFSWTPIDKPLEINPRELLELFGEVDDKASIRAGENTRTFLKIGKKVLLVYHDGDDTGVSIIGKAFSEHEDPKEALEALQDSLIPTVDEVLTVVELIPKEPFEIRDKPVGFIKKLTKIFARQDVRKEFVAYNLEDVLVSQPKDDLERLLRIVAAALSRSLPHEYPAPSIEEIEKTIESIRKPLYKKIGESYLSSYLIGSVIPLLKTLQESREEIVEEMKKNPEIALLFVQDPSFSEAVRTIEEKFSGTIRQAYSEFYALLKDLQEPSIEKIVAILGTFKKKHGSREETFLDLFTKVLALSMLFNLERPEESIIEDVSSRFVVYHKRLIELAKKDPKVPATRISIALATSFLNLTNIGLYYYHTGKTFKPYFELVYRDLDVALEKTLGYLKFRRLSPMSAMINVSMMIVPDVIAARFLGKEPKVANTIPKKISRYISDKLDLEYLEKTSKVSYYVISNAFLSAVLLGLEYLETIQDVALEISKYAIERGILSKYAAQDATGTYIALTALSEAYKRKEASREALVYLLDYAEKLLRKSFLRDILSAEIARKLEEGGFRELAIEACKKVPKSIVCESLRVRKERFFTF